MKYNQISKRNINGINSRIESAVKKYGFDEVRIIFNRYMQDITSKKKLEESIAAQEVELQKLKEKR